MEQGQHNSRAWLHKPAYALLRAITRPYLWLRFGFRVRVCRPPDGPYLLYANHLTNMDQFMLSAAFPRQMYFVASEHLLRRGFGKLMRLLMDPIIRLKARTDADAALDILRRLRAGYNVCVFIEGERSYDGCTEWIPDSAAHLAKLSGATLVTFRLENAYFSEPRWARHVRRGPVSGRMQRCYTPRQLAAMTREEVLAAIRRDLWLDAYAEQLAQPRRFRGPRLAEYLETTLFLCPRCGGCGTLRSKGDRFACSCGLALRYTPYGMLEAEAGAEAPFATVRDWYAWQKRRLADLAAAHAQDTDTMLLRDIGQRLYRCDGYQRALIGTGEFAMYADRAAFTPADGAALVFPFASVAKFSCQERMLLSFVAGGQLYELISPFPRAAVKYQLLFQALRAGKGGV